MTRWKSDDEMSAPTYGTLINSLAVIEAQQADNPGMWGEVSRYPSPQTAAVTVTRLRERYDPAMWEFRSAKDPTSQEGVVWARYTPPDREDHDE